MGICTVMITGDNPLTAVSIAAESGVDDFLAEATPEDKLELTRTGAIRRRRRDEYGNTGRARGGQYGRPEPSVG
jgi:high-affinity K+ transport system ATPase subunit B